MRRIPIKTEIGYLAGRDAIFLDEVIYDTRTLTLKGEFNGILSTENLDGFLGYKINFKNVYYMRSIELDVSFKLLEDEILDCESSFEEMFDTDVLKAVQKARNLNLRQFMFWTYDDLFEIVCKDYELEILANREKE